MLRDLQVQFIDGIFRGDDELSIGAYIKETESRSSAQQMAIYRGSIFGGLNKAMAETYPVCKKLVGEKFFDAMVEKYIQRTPSRWLDLNDYGEDFGDFAATFTPADCLPYLPDVARLEWAWNSVFFGADSSEGNLDALAELGEEAQLKIRFQLPEDAILFCSDYPVHEIWRINQDDFKGEVEVNLQSGPVRLLVWRQGFEMRMDVLDEQQWFFLENVQAGETFAAVCEDLGTAYPEADIGRLLGTALQNGWILRFEISEI